MMNSRTKYKIKKIGKLVWYFALIVTFFYLIRLIILEREHEWKNIHQYNFKNGKYVLVNGEKETAEKPNILSIEFSNLKAIHGEIQIEGSISVSFYNLNNYFSIKQTKEKSETLKIEIGCPKERYGYNPIIADIDCMRESDESGTFCSGLTETVFIPKGGHLFDYPLDKLIFLITIKFERKIIFDQIDIYNRVRGILLKDHPTITIKDSRIVVNLL